MAMRPASIKRPPAEYMAGARRPWPVPALSGPSGCSASRGDCAASLPFPRSSGSSLTNAWDATALASWLASSSPSSLSAEPQAAGQAFPGTEIVLCVSGPDDEGIGDAASGDPAIPIKSGGEGSDVGDRRGDRGAVHAH